MYALELEQLEKTYANGIRAVKGINLQVKQGDFFALLGANGAGKSSTIGLITTLLHKTSGKIRIEGIDLDKNPTLAKSYIGLVPQEINLNIFENCEQILFTQAGYYGISRNDAAPHVAHLLQALGLEDKKHSIVRHLSGGMKRRLMIARALVHKPKLLILDEPTAGVDIEIRRSMWEFFTDTNQKGTTIILTTHYLEEAEQLCKNIAIIDKGNIVENTSMQSLLKSLNHQTFVFTTKEAFESLPPLDDYQIHIVDDHNFEIRISNQESLNRVFSFLNAANIEIHSLRHKTNRLEELFLSRIHHNAL